jgi:hypothetical protein
MLRTAMDFTSDFAGFLGEHKRYWLLPLFAVLLALGLLVFLSAGSAVAPLIYTLF